LFRRTEPEPAPSRPAADGAVGEASTTAPEHELRVLADGDGATGGARGSRAVPRRRPRADRRPTGRERHEEKITVYVSPEELLDLEQAKLTLRGQHGLAVDRGRIVREAIAMVVADLESGGEHSNLVRRLRDD
jgi:hypothetical protein